MRRSHRLALTAAIALAAASAGGGAVLSAASHARARHSAAGDVATTARAAAVAAGLTREADAHRAEVLAASSSTDRDTDDDPDRRKAKLGYGVARVVLDAPQIAFGSALAVAGRDLAAPRALDLWRIVEGRAARVAVGQSVEGGALEFPALVLPAGDVTLVAAPHGSGPTGPGASSPATVRRDPNAPRVVAVETVEAGARALVLHVDPAERDGEIVVTSASGAREVERARALVVADAEGIPAALDVAVALVDGDRELSVAQVLPDGRRSPVRPVSIELPTLEKTSAEVIAVTP